jgi:hypothetical protein
VSTYSGFPVFGQNREPELGYPGFLFWETGTRTGTLVYRGPGYQPVLVVPDPVSLFFKKKKKKTFWAYFRLGLKQAPFFFFFFISWLFLKISVSIFVQIKGALL